MKELLFKCLCKKVPVGSFASCSLEVVQSFSALSPPLMWRYLLSPGSLSAFPHTESSSCIILLSPWTAPAQGENFKKTRNDQLSEFIHFKFNVLGFGTLCLNACCPGFSSINHPCACLQFGPSICWYYLYFSRSDFPQSGQGCSHAVSAGKELHKFLQSKATHKLLCIPKRALKTETKAEICSS